MNIAGIIHESLIDGVGIRTVVFISGCKHNCKNCHNEKLFNFNYGKQFDKSIEDYIIDYVKNDPLIDGITISGGDPMYSELELESFLKRFKVECKDKSIWLYTGFCFEEIKTKPILNYVDVLVDGMFINELKDSSLRFKGSSNQRIIDINKSLEKGEIIIWED